jgi:signal transduction histidine kinase
MQQFVNDVLGQSLQNDTHIHHYFAHTVHQHLNEHWAQCLNGISFNDELAYPQVQKWYNVQLNPVASKHSDSIEGILLSIEDITNRKKVALDLQKSFQLVSEQNKRLLNFSYIVSHNLRSHASNIISISRFLEVLDSEAERKEMVQHLKTVSTALDETLHNLNEVVAIQNNINVHMQLVNVYQYVQNALVVLKNQIAEKQAVIQINIATDVYIRYNPAYLESIFLNFLSNALKYSRPNVVPTILLNMQQMPGEQWQLTITDNGMGIDMQKYGNKLFGMYKTFHGNKDARGIGLFITKNQIEAMGGSVEVQSEPQKGTTFIIRIV